MDEHGLAGCEVVTQLPDGFKEGEAFDIANRAADLDQHEIHVVGIRDDRFLDRIGNVGNDLHGRAR